MQISHALGRDWKKDLEDYLVMYYTTPYSSTGNTPTGLCYGRTIRSKLPCIEDIETAPPASDYRDKDHIQKSRGKEYEDRKRHAIESDIQTGDTVLMQRLTKSNKLQTTLDKNKYTVIERTGPKAIISDAESGRKLERNVAHLKRIPTPSVSSINGSDSIMQKDVAEDSNDTEVIERTNNCSNDISVENEEVFRGFDNEECG